MLILLFFLGGGNISKIGKTVTCEIALLRLLKNRRGAKAVYIAPLKALARERLAGTTLKSILFICVYHINCVAFCNFSSNISKLVKWSNPTLP